MKKFLIASLLLLNSTAIAKTTQAPNVSVTAAADDADSVAKVNAYSYGMDANGVNRRIIVDTNGAASSSVSSQTFPSWTLLSNTTRTISAPIVLNLTATAGSSGIMKYQLGSSNSNSAGFYWTVLSDSTYIPPRNYYATSTTAFIDDYLTAGTHVCLSPVSATDISNTVQVLIWKLTQVVP